MMKQIPTNHGLGGDAGVVDEQLLLRIGHIPATNQILRRCNRQKQKLQA